MVPEVVVDGGDVDVVDVDAALEAPGLGEGESAEERVEWARQLALLCFNAFALPVVCLMRTAYFAHRPSISTVEIQKSKISFQIRLPHNFLCNVCISI